MYNLCFRKNTTIRKFSTNFKLPECDFVPKKYNGPSNEKLKEIRKSRINPAVTHYYSSPLILNQGHMQWLFDTNGKRYLDMFGGICTVSVGHCHPKITAAVKEQMETLCHVSNVYYHPKLCEYADKLASKLPGNLKVVYLVNSGSEANDLAILLARAYTNNFDVMSLKGCYHGMSYQTMALTGNGYYKFPVPQAAGFIKTMNPDVFRGIWGGKNCRDSPIQTHRNCSCSANECQAERHYVEQFQQEFDVECKNNLAAFFVESIQGVGGAVQYPKNYVKDTFQKVKSKGGLFVSDEVQTGFGRTGDHYWGFENHGIIPDIVTMAKGIGNGYPLAAVVTTPEVAQALTKAGHFNTFGGNPVACTVGMTVLDIVDEEKLQENCKTIGNYLLTELEKVKKEFPIIGDVRGKGLMIGIEMVEKENSTVPLDNKKILKIWEYCRDNSLLLGKGGLYANVFRIKPPMCITKEDAEYTVNVFKEAIKSV